MSEGLQDIWNELAADVIPEVFDAVHTDLLNILTESGASDEGGSRIKSAAASNASPIPCIYEPKTSSYKNEASGKILSKMQYVVTFPRTQNGVLINVSPNDRLQILARGAEPQKTFRIEAIGNQAGVLIEAMCVLEN